MSSILIFCHCMYVVVYIFFCWFLVVFYRSFFSEVIVLFKYIRHWFKFKYGFCVRLLELHELPCGMAFLAKICFGLGKLGLCQARLLRGDIAPFLHNRLLHLPGIGSRPCANLLRHVHTLFSWLQFRHQLCHMLARSLRFKTALLLWGILHHSLNFVIAFQWSLVEEYACETKICSISLFKTFLKPHPAGAQISRGSFVQPVMGVYFFTDFFDTLEGIIWGLIGQCFLVENPPADLSRPLRALSGGGVARGVGLAFLLHLRSAFNHVVLQWARYNSSWIDNIREPAGDLDVVFLLFRPTLWLVFGSEKEGKGYNFMIPIAQTSRCSPADLISTTVAVFYKRLAANSCL